MNKNQNLACAVPTTYSHISAPDGAQTLDGTVPVKKVAANTSEVDDLYWGLSTPKPVRALTTQPTPTNAPVVSITSVPATTPPTVTIGPVAAGPATTYPTGEVGFADRFADYWGKDTRFDTNRQVWMTWKSVQWQLDECGHVVERMKAIAGNILAIEVPAMRGKSTVNGDYYDLQAKALSQAGNRLNNNATIRSSLSLAQSIPKLVTRTAEYDADGLAFNCLSGTIDLRTGTVKPHERSDLITNITPIALAPEGTDCPKWKKFLSEAMLGDQTMVDYLQRMVGYMLTGDTGYASEQCFFMLYGKGSNGKSVFLNVVQHILGDYSHIADFNTFLDTNRGAAPRNDLAGMVGKRMVLSSECKKGAKFDETVLKQCTGNDSISVRMLHKEYFSFKPVAKIVLASNHKPSVAGTDAGIWRRVRILPWLGNFLKSQDKTLESNLKAEAPAILRWAVEGCLVWQRDGLGMPNAIEQATSAYRSSQDSFQTFLDDCCTVDPTAREKSQALYDAYARWCAVTNNRFPMKQTGFNQELEERGFTRKKTSSMNAWDGLKLAVHQYGTSQSTQKMFSVVPTAITNSLAESECGESITTIDAMVAHIDGDLNFGN